MTDAPVVTIQSKDVELDEPTRHAFERRLETLAREFPEVSHYEVHLALDGAGHLASARVTGKGTELGGEGRGEEPRHALDRLLDALERQLRRGHDKRIFQRRREAQRRPPKRGS